MTGLVLVVAGVSGGRNLERSESIPRLTARLQPTLSLEEWKRGNRKFAAAMVMVGGMCISASALALLIRLIR